MLCYLLTKEYVLTIREQIKEHGSIRKAAAALGIPRSTLQYRLKREPEQNISALVPDDFGIERSTITVEPDGTLGRQWLKTKYDPQVIRDRLEDIRQEFCSTLPRFDLDIPTCASGDENLFTMFVITDYHLGMLSWAEETGSNWSMDIAEQLFIKYFKYAIQNTPAAKVAILGNIGDFLHFSGMKAITNHSGHVLDADTRYSRLVRVAIKMSRIAVAMLLEKYEEVHVFHMEGNHDDDASIWLRESVWSHYENEPRVIVSRRVDPYHCFERGDVTIFMHHGHLRRSRDLETILIAKFREQFGRTRKSYAHTGHFHNKEVISVNNMRIEQHPTLAAADSYATRGGWMSNMRESPVITYDQRYGEIGRIVVPVELLESM